MKEQDLLSPPKNSHSMVFSYGIAIIAYIMWGTSYAFGKSVTPDPLQPMLLSSIQTLIGAIAIFIIILVSKQLKEWFLEFKKNFWKYMGIGITLYAAAFYIEYWSLGHTKASNQAILSNTAVIWMVILNMVVYKQKPSKKLLLGIGISIIGIILILFSEEISFSSGNLVGNLGTLLAYLIWGIYTLIQKKMSEKTNPLYSTLSTLIGASFILIPMSIVEGSFGTLLDLSGKQWVIVSYLGIFCVGVAFWLYNVALSNPRINTNYITSFSLLNPIIGVIMGWLLLEEDLSLREFVGVVFILAALLIINFQPKRAEQSNLGKNKVEIQSI
jgi:drug/metabolite transporter (DMT)-like permease